MIRLRAVLAVCLAAAATAAGPVRAASPPQAQHQPQPQPQVGPVTAERQGGCHYRIRIETAAVDALAVTFRCAGEGPVVLGGFRGIPLRFARDARPGPGGTMLRLPGRLVFTGAGGVTRGAYRFNMKALLAAVSEPSVGQRVGGSVVTSVSSFLLYPAGAEVPLSIEFAAPPGTGVATAFRRTGTVQFVRSADIPVSGYMVLGRMTRLAIRLPGQQPAGADGGPAPPAPALLDVAVLDVPMAVDRAELGDWIRQSAAQVARYFRGFPAPRALLVLRPVPGATRVLRGVVISGGGPTVMLQAGSLVDRARLFEDWRLVHELIHIGSPFLGARGRWLNEGIAVYVQTLVHVRAGWLDEKQAWRGFMTQMPRGLGALTGDGLSSARGTAPVYWGGALFMLLADVDIRKRTDGAKSLADCLRGVLRAGGDSAQRWTVDRMLRDCDRATGTGTMARLAARHVSRGAPLDLDGLWRDLGVALGPDGVRYDDAAPLARFRRAIMRGRSGR